jgi:Arc/MetJ family transcription regulator
VTRTLIDADDDLLARAQEILATGSKKDTVNAALAQVVALKARRDFVEDGRSGALADAEEPTVLDEAWRR